MANAIDFVGDEYDDLADLVELQANTSGSTLPGEKIVRRRSSKGI